MRRPVSCLVLFLITFISSGYLHAQPPAKQAYFSPRGGCTQAIVDNLSHTERTVLIQAYSFTSEPIAEALIDAHKRGVKVKILLDKSQRHGKGSKVDLLVNDGIPVSIDTKHAIAHNKVMIIDGVIVMTGSFNFTNAAEDRNAENLLIVRDKFLATKYRNNWNKHQKHSTPYTAIEDLKQ